MYVDELGIFYNNLEYGDHAEALEIDRRYDDLSRTYDSASALEWAIEDANTTLIPGQLYASRFGYTVARDALRWWQYRNAYLTDLIDASEEQLFADSPEPGPIVEAFKQDKRDSEDLLTSRDPLIFNVFARLEALRSRREREDENIDDPLDMERKYGLTLVMNELDRLLDHPDTSRHDGIALRATSLKLSPAGQTETFEVAITKESRGSESKYDLIIFSQEDGPDESGASEGRAAVYTVVETPELISWNFNAGPDFERVSIFDLARMLAPEEKYVMDRPTSPIPELAENY